MEMRTLYLCIKTAVTVRENEGARVCIEVSV